MKRSYIIILTILLFTSCHNANPNRCGYKNGDPIIVNGKFKGVVSAFGSAYESKDELSVKYFSETGEVIEEYIPCQFIRRDTIK